jgi:hypothetical protein
MMNVATLTSLRNLPFSADYGAAALFWMLLAALCFFIDEEAGNLRLQSREEASPSFFEGTVVKPSSSSPKETKRFQKEEAERISRASPFFVEPIYDLWHRLQRMVALVTNRRCVYQTAYHVIWCPKYRRDFLSSRGAFGADIYGRPLIMWALRATSVPKQFGATLNDLSM